MEQACACTHASVVPCGEQRKIYLNVPPLFKTKIINNWSHIGTAVSTFLCKWVKWTAASLELGLVWQAALSTVCYDQCKHWLITIYSCAEGQCCSFEGKGATRLDTFTHLSNFGKKHLRMHPGYYTTEQGLWIISQVLLEDSLRYASLPHLQIALQFGGSLVTNNAVIKMMSCIPKKRFSDPVHTH